MNMNERLTEEITATPKGSKGRIGMRGGNINEWKEVQDAAKAAQVEGIISSIEEIRETETRANEVIAIRFTRNR
jgi:hypothetical protein